MSHFGASKYMPSFKPQAIDDLGWCQNTRMVRSPNFDARPQSCAVELIVLHAISLPRGCYQNGFVDRFFSNQLDCRLDPSFSSLADLRVSSHFFISRSGVLTQFVSCKDRAWHAGRSCYQGRENCNDFSIGIELEGCNEQCFTAPQYDRLVHLCASLMVKYPQLNSQTIVGHEHVAFGRKTDPGPWFDWGRLWRDLVAL